MEMMDFKISDLKKVLSNPEILKEVRKMDPKLESLSDDDFNKVVNGVDDMCDKFTDKFGNMTGEEVLDLGIKQEQEKLKNNKKGNNTMTLEQALKSLKPVKDYDKLKIQEKLNGGFTLLLANKQGFNIAFETVLRVKENVLYSYKLTESTPEHIVLTLYRINRMNPGLFDIIYDTHIIKSDMLFEDVDDILSDVDENTWGNTEDDINELLKKSDVLVFNDK